MATNDSLAKFWQPLNSITEHVARAAKPRQIYDVGGRADRSFLGTNSVGPEGKIKRDLESDMVTLHNLQEFLYCRHTIQGLSNPQYLLQHISRDNVAGYIETPSPLAELTRGVDGSGFGHRGYIHHRWIVGFLDGVLTLVPKYPIVEFLRLSSVQTYSSCLSKGPLQWNTYYLFKEDGFDFRILRHERDFRLDRFTEYIDLLDDLVYQTIYNNSQEWSKIVTEDWTVELPPDPHPQGLGRVVSVGACDQDASRVQVAPPPPEPEPPLTIRLMFARFPGGGMDRVTVTNWLVGAVLAAKQDRRIDQDILNWDITDTPITMGRNRAIEAARETHVDFLVMVDNDMAPDHYLPSNPKCERKDYRAKPFFQSSFDFLYSRRVAGEMPAVVAAPYCGPPPFENVYVFHWHNKESNGPPDNADISLEQFGRAHAASMKGVTEVAALPTGLIMIDMRAVDSVDPPYFYYEWKDKTESEKASTEDVTYTRDSSLNGVPQFCNWDAWCGHWKWKCVGRPELLSPASVSEKFKRPLLERYNIKGPDERVVMVGPQNGQGAQGPQ